MTSNRKVSRGKILYTVGHSKHPIEHFIYLLKEHAVSLVFDVRSIPYSRRNPQFSKKALAVRLRDEGIDYVFAGGDLGAKSPDPDCYVDGKVRYELITARPGFAGELNRIVDKTRDDRPALLCAEEDPLTCHRTILVCRPLRERIDSILHIRGDGSIETNEAFEQRLLKATELSGNDLFESETSIMERAYDLRGQRMTKV